MKTVILAGGQGSRLAEETRIRPKALIEIGGHPILWHVMMIYHHHGFDHFLVALGYKGGLIKKYLVDYCALESDLTVRLGSGDVQPHAEHPLDWTVDLIDTGIDTLTGGRIKRLAPHIGGETFMLTWCDGLADIDLAALVAFHRSHGKLATVTAVHPPARYGHLRLDGDQVAEFTEKPQAAEGWINGAFFVLEPGVLDYIDGDETQWEREPLERLARDGQLMAYRHETFWQCMDTLREKHLLEELWRSGRAPWRTWQ